MCVGQVGAQFAQVVEERRFTPTCVGQVASCLRAFSSASRFTPTCVGQVLPFRGIRLPLRGSPPRAWGRSRAGRQCAARTSVHPHVRGAGGRGVFASAFQRRFTPTCVGQVFTISCWVLFISTVHPHVRRAGGYRRPIIAIMSRFTPTCVGQVGFETTAQFYYYGSPPRAWGRYTHSGMGGQRRRFTPTCVGQVQTK